MNILLMELSSCIHTYICAQIQKHMGNLKDCINEKVSTSELNERERVAGQRLIKKMERRRILSKKEIKGRYIRQVDILRKSNMKEA